jgi:hypothetical protein
MRMAMEWGNEKGMNKQDKSIQKNEGGRGWR